MGLDGRGAARGKSRAAILSEFDQHPWVFETWPDLENERSELRLRVEKLAHRKLSLLKAGPLSTSAGLSNRSSTECIGEIVTHGIVFDEPIAATSLFRANPSPDRLIDEVPAIDLPTLVAAINRTGTSLRSFNLLWSHKDVRMQIGVDMDLRPTFQRGIDVRNLFGSGIADGGQPVRIVDGHRGRIRFVCPLTGHLADTLFIRDGTVGSRRALRLRYPSEAAERRRMRKHAAKRAPDPRAHAQYRAALEQYHMADGDLRPLTPAEQKAADAEEKLRAVLLQRGLAGDVQANWHYLKVMGMTKPEPVIHKFLDEYEEAAFENVLSAARIRARTRPPR